MYVEIRREDIDDLIKRVRTLIGPLTRDTGELRREALSARAGELMLEMRTKLGLGRDSALGRDVGLDRAARICAYYAEAAKALNEAIASTRDQDSQQGHQQAFSRHLISLFDSLTCLSLMLGNPARHLQLRLNQRELHIPLSENSSRADDLEQLFQATIRRYEERTWRTAAQAARHITPEIVELAATLANRRAGKPLLRSGTSKPLEWIRGHRRSKA